MDLNVPEIGRQFFHHPIPFISGKRVLLARVRRNNHEYFIVDGARSLYEIQVTVGRRVK